MIPPEEDSMIMTSYQFRLLTYMYVIHVFTALAEGDES